MGYPRARERLDPFGCNDDVARTSAPRLAAREAAEHAGADGAQVVVERQGRGLGGLERLARERVARQHAAGTPPAAAEEPDVSAA